MSYEINDMKIFATWSHKNSYNTDCTICRQPLNNHSIYEKDKSQYFSNVVMNSCGHSFHKECIKSWLSDNNHCPNCSTKWTTPYTDWKNSSADSWGVPPADAWGNPTTN